MKKLFVTTIICIVISVNVFAQKGYAEKINQFNNKGQKDGLWKEGDEYFRTEIYYQNGKKNGSFKSYNAQSGELYGLGEYKNDTITGTWYYFGDFGHLMMIQKDFRKNDKQTPVEHNVKRTLPFQCYCTTYHPNGIKESEGILLWDEDPESDLTFEYGEWKYYSDTGELIETKTFK